MDNLKDNSLPEFQGILREAEARAEGDYLLGYNYSPLLTLTRAYRQTLSYGRCQTSLLNLVYLRDKQVREFKPKPYWTVEAAYAKGFKGTLVDEQGKSRSFFDRAEAEAVRSTAGGIGTVVSYGKQEKKEKAPLLYNLAKLQQDMGRMYSFSPDQTLQIAQALYEKHKILSYPRTDSQYLSMDIYHEITEHLESCRFGKFKDYIHKINFDTLKADRSYFNDLKVTDHHALIPTINGSMGKIYDTLSDEERKVFDVIVLSLTAIFYPEYRYDATKIVVDIGGNMFQSSGTTILQLGYREVLKSNGAERNKDLQILPKLQEGDNLAVDSISLLNKTTKSPGLYNDETIVKAMEKYHIGTSATRAETIKKLQNPKRQFIVREKGKYSVTELGEEYIKVVPEELKTPELTRRFEEELSRVNEGSLAKEEFLENLVEDIRGNLIKFTSTPIPDERKIGYAAAKKKEETAVLGKCPKCGGQVIKGKFGAYCANKCGMNVSRIMGVALTDAQVKDMLDGKKILLKGLKSKAGKPYDAYIIPNGTEEYRYTKDGKEKRGVQFKIVMEFPKKKSFSRRN